MLVPMVSQTCSMLIYHSPRYHPLSPQGQRLYTGMPTMCRDIVGHPLGGLPSHSAFSNHSFYLINDFKPYTLGSSCRATLGLSIQDTFHAYWILILQRFCWHWCARIQRTMIVRTNMNVHVDAQLGSGYLAENDTQVVTVPCPILGDLTW